jgi:hypothetical protein
MGKELKKPTKKGSPRGAALSAFHVRVWMQKVLADYLLFSSPGETNRADSPVLGAA